MKQKVIIICFVIVFVLISGIMYISKESKDVYNYEVKTKSTMARDDLVNKSQDLLESSSFESNSEPQEIAVYLCGAILKEGVYYLKEGDRVIQAVELAGGLDISASSTYVNLARALVDGESIYFPTIDEEVEINLQLIKEEEESTLININNASKEKLMTLPGIGEAKALAIIDYRNQNQGFSNIEDIKKVSGIKEALFSTLKTLICI